MQDVGRMDILVQCFLNQILWLVSSQLGNSAKEGGEEGNTKVLCSKTGSANITESGVGTERKGSISNQTRFDTSRGFDSANNNGRRTSVYIECTLAATAASDSVYTLALAHAFTARSKLRNGFAIKLLFHLGFFFRSSTTKIELEFDARRRRRRRRRR